MTNIELSEDFIRRLIQCADDAGDMQAAQLLRDKLPPELPTEVGAVIMWRESNDAGHNIGTFAERVNISGDGEDQWRLNGFDLYTDRMMATETKGKTWWIMEPKK